MGSTQFGNFNNFCRDSTLPVCNLLSSPNHDQNGDWGGCELRGITLSRGRHLGNLGSILLAGLAIAIAGFLLLKSERKRAAVGRREMQLFLLGYILISICEIFSVGEFPLNKTARIVFSAVHIGAIVATTWILWLNAVVGYQLIDDGTPVSLGLITLSAGALLIGTGYIGLDTALSWTGFWDSSLDGPRHRSIALYVLYQLAPLVFLVAFFVLEAVLVLRVLGEKRPLIYLVAAALLFAIGQIFNYVISKYICSGTSGKVDGALFQTFFTLLSVVMIWIFWSSITEDDWPSMTGGTYDNTGYGTGNYGTNYTAANTYDNTYDNTYNNTYNNGGSNHTTGTAAPSHSAVPSHSAHSVTGHGISGQSTSGDYHGYAERPH